MTRVPFLCLFLLLRHGAAQDSDRPVRVVVYPQEISLSEANDLQRIVVLASFFDGTTEDVTERAEIAFGTQGVVERRGAVLSGRSNGTTSLIARFQRRVGEASVRVSGVEQKRPISFRRDVIPVLTRAGCNSGGCHGSATGKNGFRLSLFGFDPEKDHVRVTRELRGRRLDPACPEASLLLTKPTVKVSHKGGRRLDPEDDLYGMLYEWIEAGAALDGRDGRKLVGIDVLPREVVLGKAGALQSFVVLARYDDGTDRDVTGLALLSSSNPTTAALEADARIKAGAPGEAFVMARFGTYAQVAQVLVLPEGSASFAWPRRPVVNYIDAALQDKLRKMRLEPAELCSDQVFLRRVFLDVINILPTPGEVEAFLADARPDKRARLVDELLERPEFADVWAMEWAEVLRVESQLLEPKGAVLYMELLRNAFRSHLPFDVLVRDLLSSSGSNFSEAAVNFYVSESDPKIIAENVAQTFLGIRIQCAQCHNHPFERWTMDDYYGFSAFFARIARKRGEHPYETVISNRGGGEVRHPKNGEVVPPRYLGGELAEVPRDGDRRSLLADWLTSSQNPWFAANVANRVFARFMGRGLVDPVDDVRVSNPPSHPDLHRELGQKLVGYRYDVRPLIRDICQTVAYQLAATGTEAQDGTFARAPVRRLSAEQLLEAIGQVTDVPTKLPGLPEGARATEIPDGNPRNRFLDLFGRPRRTSVCTCDRRGEPTLAQALHLINGATINAKIRHRSGRLAKSLAAKRSNEEILDDLYMAAYSRHPTEREKQQILSELAQEKDRAAYFEDLYFAVLNSREFLFNH